MKFASAIRLLELLTAAVLGLAACSAPTLPGKNFEGSAAPPRCEAAPVTCKEESLQKLTLFDVATDAGVVDESTDSDSFLTLVNASAGGLSPKLSYTYGRFDAEGFVQTHVSDEDALSSLDWDIAFRRSVIRINSGIAGPSCVTAALLPPGTDFDAVDRAPAGMTWKTDGYFDEQCKYVADEVGIGGPLTAIGEFYSYASCLQMNGNVYLLHLRDRHYIKLQVQSYYSPAAQDACNKDGAAPIPSGAGSYRIRWAFIRAPRL